MKSVSPNVTHFFPNSFASLSFQNFVSFETIDENPKIAQIQGPMTRSGTKQSVDTLQQMVSDILNKAQVEKDEGPRAEALPRILIVAEGPD